MTHNYRKALLDKYISSAYRFNHGAPEKFTVKNDLNSYLAFFRYNYSGLLPDDRGVNILEIGPGMGQFMDFLRMNGYQDCRGIDGSSEVVDYCRQHGHAVDLCENFVDYFADEKHHESLDVIIANDILEHFTKIELFELLSNLRRCLKPKGVLIAKIPNASACFVGSHNRYCDFTHEIAFTELSVRQLFLGLDYSRISMHSPQIFCFYHNPLNYLGMAFNFILKWLQIFLHRMHGSFDVTIVSGNMIIKVEK